MKKEIGVIFHTRIAHNTYQLSSSSSGYGLEPGKASCNSYLIIGESSAVLFDLALEEPGLYEYAERLSGKHLNIVLSHAHVDHIYYLSDEHEVWLGRDDETLLRNGSEFQKGVKPCPKLHLLDDGGTIDLGGRILRVIHIPGHTDGSILLFDEAEGLLFSGDTVTRRLLYGLHGVAPVDIFCGKLQQLKKLGVTAIYSAHDRCALGMEHIDLMVSVMKEEGNYIKNESTLPLIGKMMTIEYGSEESIAYFSYAYKAK